MANRTVFQQKIFQDYIDKFDECMKLENDKLSTTGSTISKGELLEKMISDYYFKLQGQTSDADTVNKINQFIDDGLETKLSNVEKKIDLVAFNSSRTNTLLETFMRIAIGTKTERIKARMNADNSTYEEAEQEYNEWLDKMFKEKSPVVEIIDSMIYEDSEEDK